MFTKHFFWKTHHAALICCCLHVKKGLYKLSPLPAWKEIKWRIKLKTQVVGVQGVYTAVHMFLLTCIRCLIYQISLYLHFCRTPKMSTCTYTYNSQQFPGEMNIGGSKTPKLLFFTLIMITKADYWLIKIFIYSYSSYAQYHVMASKLHDQQKCMICKLTHLIFALHRPN